MSRGAANHGREPLIALATRAQRALETDMIAAAHRAGHTMLKRTHNAVFATLPAEGMRTVDMAERMSITRQSMGEIVRDMVALGLLEMRPDPTDRRAKLVTYTAKGLQIAKTGSQYIEDLERRLTEEIGAEHYEITRHVLAQVAEALDNDSPPN